MKFLKEKTNRELIIILLAIIFGCGFGYYAPDFMTSYAWVGKIFMNYLMFLVLPLIFFALVSAVTSLGDIKKLGLLGKYSIFAILLNVALASFIGLIFSLMLKPGQGVSADLLISGFNSNLFSNEKSLTFSDFITEIFPPNLAEVVVKSQILPLVVFSVFFAIIAIKNSPKKTVDFVIQACAGCKDIFLDMIGVVMKFTPIAMFFLIGNAVSTSLLSEHFSEDMLGIFKFILVFIIGCIFLCFLQFIILFVVLGKNAGLFFTKSLKSSTTGFATSSSMATLPVMLLNSQDLEIDETVSKFMLPLTVVFNLGSTSLYVASATLFVTQVLHINVTVWSLIVIYFTTLLTGLGTTGIPNAGFIATMTVLRAISIPTSAVAILFPIDAILSRVRTSVNIWGHLVCTKCVDIWLKKPKIHSKN